MIIRCGFQSGVDIAGARAAHSVGLPTAGWMPRGFRTLAQDGRTVEFHPEYAELYGARETPSEGWSQRTIWNVRESNIVLLLGNPHSAGSRFTASLAAERSKPLLWVPLPNSRLRRFAAKFRIGRSDRTIRHFPVRGISTVARAISMIRPRVLMVAGNRETDPPTIGMWAQEFLTEVFQRVKES